MTAHSGERGIVRLYKVLRRKGRTALLVDLTVPPSQGAVAIHCFGLKTSVTSAHAWLNERTGVPIIPAHCEPLPNGRYRLIFHPKINASDGMSHQEIAQACWNSFEPYVRKNPAPWLWMYKHWRYLPANADRSYPFYANFYRPFEDMLKGQTAGSLTEDNEGNEGPEVATEMFGQEQPNADQLRRPYNLSLHRHMQQRSHGQNGSTPPFAIFASFCSSPFRPFRL